MSKRYLVSLDLTVEDDDMNPASWDWPVLLDLPDRSDVTVLGAWPFPKENQT